MNNKNQRNTSRFDWFAFPRKFFLIFVFPHLFGLLRKLKISQIRIQPFSSDDATACNERHFSLSYKNGGNRMKSIYTRARAYLNIHDAAYTANKVKIYCSFTDEEYKVEKTYKITRVFATQR